MTSTYSPNLKLTLMGTGDQSGTWGDTTNTNLGTLVEEAIAGYTTQALTGAGPTALTIPDGTTSVGRNYVIEFTGTPTAGHTVTVPAVDKPYILFNNTNIALIVKVSGQTGFTIAVGKKAIAYTNSTDLIEVANAPVTEAGTQTLTNKTLTSPTIATPTITTSATVPLVIGGTAVSSALTLQSTSGVGTSDSIAFKVGNNGATTAMTANTSGNIEFRAGTAALPAITTTGDTNTGIFFPAADTIAFTEGGAEAMRINSSGNTLIGTSNTPSNKDTTTPKLVVSGSGIAASMQVVRHTSVGSSGGILELTSTRGTDVNSYTILQSGDGIGALVFAGADGNEFVAAASVLAQVDGTPGDNDMPGRLVFNTTADGGSGLTERMRIDSSGNVGIGTASPSGPLNVVATSASALAIAINGRSSDNLGAMYFYANNGTTQQATITASASEFRLSSVPAAAVQTFYTNSAERMRINSSGNLQIYNLGLGNTTPSTSGTGITFPATQSASTDANTLDDYEEGTWSAVVAGESGTITTYSITTTYYTKIGNIVNAFVRFTVSNLGTGSNFVVSGLPFAAAAELLGIWSETNTTGLTGFMFTTVAPGATSFTSRLASNWGGQCLVNGTYTVQVTYKVQ